MKANRHQDASLMPASFDSNESSGSLSGSFDYRGLDPELVARMQRVERRVRPLSRKLAETIAEIGRELISVRDQLEHGRFVEWIETQCGLSRTHAYRCIDVAERLGSQISQLGNLPLMTLYALAAKATPDDVRDHVV